MKIECDQCEGTGTANGHRCPCREEDDRAQAMRSRMQLVRKPPTAASADAKPYNPPTQTQQRRGKSSHGKFDAD